MIFPLILNNGTALYENFFYLKLLGKHITGRKYSMKCNVRRTFVLIGFQKIYTSGMFFSEFQEVYRRTCS